MRMDDHLDDMHAVVEAEGLERFVLGGWSMAVQLSLEYAHRRPADVRALVLINGPFERALTHLLPIPGGEALAMAAARVGSKAARVLNPLSRGLLGARHATWALTHTGLLAADAGFFADVLAEFSRVDWGLYLTMTRQLHQHSAAGYLGELDTPTLVTAGARDLLTPVRMARRLHEGIRGSELVVFPKATHYIVAEVPEALCDAIADFFGRRLPG
jgi:pimeloyl-ACP methyl ester carboxylesterase